MRGAWLRMTALLREPAGTERGFEQKSAKVAKVGQELTSPDEGVEFLTE